MWNIIKSLLCLCLYSIIWVSNAYNGWSVHTNDLQQYSLEYMPYGVHTSYSIIYEACPEFIDSNTGTRISVCDTNIYTLHNQSYPVRQKNDILGTYSEYILDYSPVSNKYLPEVNCVFMLLDSPNSSVIIRLQLSKIITTNWLSPLSNGKWDIQTNLDDTRILNVPPDNDLQSYYLRTKPNILTKDTSNYVTAFYEYLPNSSKGLIVGFLEHDIFKTGITYTYKDIHAVAGINGLLLTRDRIPHGIVNVSFSPMLFIHINQDWRNGMEEYASMIQKISTQKQKSQSPQPFTYTIKGSSPISGWNSWAMAVGHIGEPNKTNLIAASDVLGNLSSSGLDSNQYIVRDAIYNLNQSQTDIWEDYVNNKPNQYTGTYTSPFIIYDHKYLYVDCNTDLCIPSNTSLPCYKFNDIILKDIHGKPITPILENVIMGHKRIIDVTHPAIQCILTTTFWRVKKNNMTLIKMDFLNYAAYEGDFYNKSIAKTGMQAYTYSLQLLYDSIYSDIYTWPIVLDYGISLPFPVGPGITMRRHTCDQMYGGVAYSMNAYTYGWWLHNVYMLNPDLITFQENYWFKPPLSKITKTFSMDYFSRVLKGVVYGGFYANGDDISNATNAKLVQTYFGNKKVNLIWSVAKIGYSNTMFRPVSYVNESLELPFISAIEPSQIYVRNNNNSVNIAIFNFGIVEKLFTIHIHSYLPNFTIKKNICINAWNNQTYTLKNNILKVSMPKTSSLLFECY